MGTDITLFLEFYGLPGCGKSTVSHQVADELRKQGKSVIEPTFELDHILSGGKRKAVKLLKLVRFTCSNPRRCRQLMRLIKDNGYKGSKLISQAANIAPKLLTYEKAKVDYVVFDEGLTQSAISLCSVNGNSVENEAKLFALCKKRYVRKFYIKVDLDTALERMDNRSQHDSRIEKIKDEKERRKAIVDFEKKCEAISSGFVIAEKIVSDAVKSIMRQIHLIREK